MVTDNRRTVRVPDSEWEIAQQAAAAAGENISDWVRGVLRQAALANPSAAETEYRATLLDPPSDAPDPLVVYVRRPLAEDEVRRLFPRKRWHLEAREVTPWHPASKRPLLSNHSDD